MTSAADWIDLSGKVAHVTGGGKGIGKGISTALAMAGAKVMVSDIITCSPHRKRQMKLGAVRWSWMLQIEAQLTQH